MIQILKSLILLLLLASCSTLPSGPGVLVLPGADKDFTQFHNDDGYCRQIAHNQIESSQIKPNSLEAAQQQYDMSFIQCMYGKGHRVPVLDQILDDSQEDSDGPSPKMTEPPPKE